MQLFVTGSLFGERWFLADEDCAYKAAAMNYAHSLGKDREYCLKLCDDYKLLRLIKEIEENNKEDYLKIDIVKIYELNLDIVKKTYYSMVIGAVLE